MVGLASVALLAVTAGSALAAPSPAPTAAPVVEVIFAKRGLLDFLGFGDDNETTTTSSSLTPEEQARGDASLGFLDLTYNAKMAVTNNSVCANDCQAFVEKASNFSLSGDSDSKAYIDEVCDKSVKNMNKCAKCLGGNNTELASNWTTYTCSAFGYTAKGGDDGNSGSSLVAQGGLAAALVAGGLALLF